MTTWPASDRGLRALSARFATPTRVEEYAIEPVDGGHLEVFYEWCLPAGWLRIEGPMQLDAALARRFS